MAITDGSATDALYTDPRAPCADPAAPCADPAAPCADPRAPCIDPRAPCADPAAPCADPRGSPMVPAQGDPMTSKPMHDVASIALDADRVLAAARQDLADAELAKWVTSAELDHL